MSEKPNAFLQKTIHLPGIGYITYEMNNHEYLDGAIPLPAEFVKFKNAKLRISGNSFLNLINTGQISCLPDALLRAMKNNGSISGDYVEIPLTIEERSNMKKLEKFLSANDNHSRLSFKVGDEVLCKAYFTKDHYYDMDALEQCIIGKSVSGKEKKTTNPTYGNVIGYCCNYSNGKATSNENDCFGVFIDDVKDMNYYCKTDDVNDHKEGFKYKKAELVHRDGDKNTAIATRMCCTERTFNQFEKPANYSEESITCKRFGYCISCSTFTDAMVQDFKKNPSIDGAIIDESGDKYDDVPGTDNEIVSREEHGIKTYYYKIGPNVAQDILPAGVILKTSKTIDVPAGPGVAGPYKKIDSVDVFFSDCRLTVKVPSSMGEVKAQPSTDPEKQAYANFITYVKEMAKNVEKCDYSKLSGCTLSFDGDKAVLEYPEGNIPGKITVNGNAINNIDKDKLFNTAMKTKYLQNKDANISLDDFNNLFIGDEITSY